MRESRLELVSWLDHPSFRAIFDMAGWEARRWLRKRRLVSGPGIVTARGCALAQMVRQSRTGI